MRSLPEPEVQNLIEDMPTRIAYALEVISDNVEFALNTRSELRDEFAKAAITGILANSEYTGYSKHPEKTFSNLAYRVADAMLRRRVQDEPTE
jgi:hypothetical protein